MSYAPLDEDSEGKQNGGIPHHAENAILAEDEETATATKAAGSGSPLRRSYNENAALSEPLTKNAAEAAAAAAATVSEHDNDHGNNEDPFYVFREDLWRKLELVDESLAEYLRIVHQTDSAANAHELKDSKRQLKRHIKNAESTLKDVSTIVELVEHDRDKFQHIHDKELYERTALVHSSRDRLRRAKHEMQSEAVKAKLLQDERAKAMRRAGMTVNGDGGSGNKNGSRNNESQNMLVDSQARQSLLMQHQDETLDELETAVVKVSEYAGSIHDEIGQQNVILTEMDEDLTNVEQELGMVMGKLARFLHTKDRWQLGTILCLSLTAIVLFLLVLYT